EGVASGVAVAADEPLAPFGGFQIGRARRVVGEQLLELGERAGEGKVSHVAPPASPVAGRSMRRRLEGHARADRQASRLPLRYPQAWPQRRRSWRSGGVWLGASSSA